MGEDDESVAKQQPWWERERERETGRAGEQGVSAALKMQN